MTTVKTIIENDKRYHIIGDSVIECNGSSDCFHCSESKHDIINEWINFHNPICILCDMKPPCYLCAKQECHDWWKDDSFNKEMGTYYGCRKSIDRTYCEDFECKYGFLGWWMPNWKKAFNERSKAIENEFLTRLRKKGVIDGNSIRKSQPARESIHKRKPSMERISSPPKKTKRIPTPKKN